MAHATRVNRYDVRLAALRVGVWLGWLSVLAVAIGLVLGLPARHEVALAALIAAAAAANGIVVTVPRRWWTTARRGRTMLNLWSAGLVGLVATLVLVGGGRSGMDLLLFLIVPFLATVHTGLRRAVWAFAALASLVVVMAIDADPLPVDQLALRLCLLAAAMILAVAFADLTRRESAARAELSARAELERVLLAESHHRVKNSLQTVSDLLLLGRPAGDEGRAFDETADRIRAIAVVHRLLAEERGAAVDAGALLRLIAAGVSPDATVTASPVRLEPAAAQHLGVVANELLTNAVRHGRPPIDVRLHEGADDLELVVSDDGGRGADTARRGLGLQLVERIVAQGLHGTFALDRDGSGRTRARVTIDAESACAS
jgi:two-component sensor histidine kinase